MTVSRFPRTSQPQVAVGVDWSNPITRGLYSALLPTVGASLFNVVNGKFLTQTGAAATREASSIGVGQRYGNAGGTSYQTEDIKNQTTGTILWFGKRNVSGPAIYRDAASGGGNTLLWDNGSDQFNVRINNVTASGVGSFPVSTPVLTVIAGDSTSASPFYVNGKLITTIAVAWGWAATLKIVLHFNYGNAQGVDATDYLWAFWDRKLSDAEIKSLSDNPWQIFAPITRPIFVSTTSTVTLPTIAQAVSDTTVGGWTSTAATLSQAINEPTRSDAEYISVSSASMSEVLLNNVVYPFTGQTVMKFSGSSTAGSTLRVQLLQHGSILTTWDFPLTSTITDYTAVLTSGQIATFDSSQISARFTTI